MRNRTKRASPRANPPGERAVTAVDQARPTRRLRAWSGALAIFLLPMGAWAFEPDWSPFEPETLILASEMNARFDAIAAALTDLEARGGCQPHAARYSATGELAFTLAGTIANFDAASYDQANAVTSGAEWQYVAPSAGLYMASASMTVHNSSIAEILRATVLVNGVALSVGTTYVEQDQPFPRVFVTDMLELAAGDRLQIHLSAANDTNLSTAGSQTAEQPSENYIWIRRVCESGAN